MRAEWQSGRDVTSKQPSQTLLRERFTEKISLWLYSRPESVSAASSSQQHSDSEERCNSGLDLPLLIPVDFASSNMESVLLEVGANQKEAVGWSESNLSHQAN